MLDDEDGPALIEDMLEAINQLADELIALPRRAAERYDKLPARVRAKVENSPPPAPV